MRRILVATDGSDSASRAVQRAAELSRALEAELVVLTVGRAKLSADEAVQARRLGIDPGDLLESFSQNILATARLAAKNAGVPAVRALECIGDPAETILDALRSEDADTVVLGRRGRGRLAGLLLGSVSQKVATLAPCSVVLVP